MSNQYFSEQEMKCHHCGWFLEDPEFLDRLTQARVDAGIPFKINSWCRCKGYDKEIRGEGNHPTGRAVDIAYGNPHERAVIVFALIKAGFQRIGIDFKKYFIHADMVIDRASPAIWSY